MDAYNVIDDIGDTYLAFKELDNQKSYLFVIAKQMKVKSFTCSSTGTVLSPENTLSTTIARMNASMTLDIKCGRSISFLKIVFLI
jgi:hypothetical protein